MKEIEKFLGGPTKNSEFLARYIGARNPKDRRPDEQSRLTYWGLPVPAQRKCAKAKFSFSHLSDDEQWPIWHSIWRESPIYDVKSVAMFWISDPKRKSLRLERYKDVTAMISEVDNWAHSDSLSAILAEILEVRPSLFDLYLKWNRSKNPWCRRQSIVGIYNYARLRKNPMPAEKSIPLVENLLEDPHFYVQRGVGWTLREIDRVNSKLQRAFVRENVRRIHPIAWFATTELYPTELRKKLVQLRKIGRG